MIKKILLFTFVFLLSLKVTADTDFGWHLRTGEYIVTQKEIPKTDLFSFTMPEYPYVYHSWGAEVLIFLSYSLGGLLGVSVFYAIILSAGIYFLYITSRLQTGKDSSFLLLLSLTPLAHSIAGGRTRVFGFLLLSVLYFVLTKVSKKDSRLLFIVPVIFLLWANLHGSFVIGLATLALFSFSQKNKTYILILSLSTLATLANPNTLGLWKQVLSTPSVSLGLKTLNPDWQSLLNFQSGGAIFALFSLAVISTVQFLKIKLDPKTQILLTASFVGSLVSSKFAIALLVFITPAICSLLQLFQTKFKKEVLSQLPVRVSLLSLMLILALMSLKNIFELEFANRTLQNYAAFLKTQSPNVIYGKTWPYTANKYLNENSQNKRILAEGNWAGYMLLLEKDQKFFFYNAMDNFINDGSSFAHEYVSVINAQENFAQKLQDYNVEVVFLPPDYPLVKKLKNDTKWKIVYEDEMAAILTPKD